MVRSSAKKVSVQKIRIMNNSKDNNKKKKMKMVVEEEEEEQRGGYINMPVVEDRLREFRVLLVRLQNSLDRVENRLSALEDLIKQIPAAADSPPPPPPFN